MTKTQKSSAIDIILLGLLKNEPMSAYDLSKIQGIHELVKISKPAVYKNVIKLEKQSYLEMVVTKYGNMPDKKIYTITDKGIVYLHKSMKDIVKHALKINIDVNAALLLIMDLTEVDGLSMIKELESTILSTQQYLVNNLEKYRHLPFPITMLAEQQILLNDTLNGWLKKFETEYRNAK